MTLLIVRHGETALNVGRVLQPADTPLSERGRRQAEALARRLAGAGAVAMVSSDLPRAWQTAQAIAAATGLAPQPSPLLHERNFGALRGQPYDAFESDPLTMDAAPPGGESMAAFHARVAAAFERLLALRAAVDGPLIVVTHGLVIRALVERHLRLAPGEPAPLGYANTSLTIAAALPPHAVERLDCTDHLDADTGDAPQGLSGG